jgi:hypothetical protein
MDAFDPSKPSKYYFDLYAEFFIKYDTLHNKCQNELIKKRITSKKYVEDHIKNNTKHCDICNIDISLSGFNNHLKSIKHHNNLTLQNTIHSLQQSK